MSERPSFSTDDVLALAKAIYEDPLNNRDGDYDCDYCLAQSFSRKTFKHDLDCPVLIAQDVLTSPEK